MPPAADARAVSHSPHPLDAYVRLVRHEAKKLSRRLPAHIEVDDLFGEGLIGLVGALRRRGAQTDTPLLPYVRKRVRGQMLDYLRLCDTLSRDDRALAKLVTKAERALATDLGRTASHAELAASVGITLAKLDKLLVQMHRGPPFQFDDQVVDDHEGADVTLEAAERASRLSGLVKRLPARLERLMRLYYYDDLSMAEIGLDFALTESRVSQLHQQAIVLLRAMCADPEL